MIFGFCLMFMSTLFGAFVCAIVHLPMTQSQMTAFRTKNKMKQTTKKNTLQLLLFIHFTENVFFFVSSVIANAISYFGRSNVFDYFMRKKEITQN